MEDSAGNRYLDMYNNVPGVGHCHPHITQAMVRQAGLLNTNTRYLSEQSIAYAERLTATLDPSLTAVVYATNVFGDALRDLLDPRMRGTR